MPTNRRPREFLSASFLITAIVALVPAAAQAQHIEAPEEGWRFAVTPYMWLASIGGKTTINGEDVSVTIPFSELADHLEFGAMIHGEGKSRRWGVMLDWKYMNLGNTVATASPDLTLRFDPKVNIIEGAVSYLVPLSDKTVVDIIAGVRSWDFSQRVGIVGTPFEFEGDVSWIDPLIGARMVAALSSHWLVHVRGDIGGFGVGSQFAWSVIVGVGYRATKNIVLGVEYMALGANYEADHEIIPELDLRTYGPLFGAAFTF